MFAFIKTDLRKAIEIYLWVVAYIVVVTMITTIGYHLGKPSPSFEVTLKSTLTMGLVALDLAIMWPMNVANLVKFFIIQHYSPSVFCRMTS